MNLDASSVAPRCSADSGATETGCADEETSTPLGIYLAAEVGQKSRRFLTGKVGSLCPLSTTAPVVPGMARCCHLATAAQMQRDASQFSGAARFWC